MKKSTRHLLLLSLTGCMFSSCVYITQSVPDMPYEGSAGRTAYPDTWRTVQPAGINYAPTPAPAPSIPEPTAAANPAAPLDLTRPILATTTPKVTKAAAPKPAATPKADPKPTTPVLQPVVTNPAPAPAAASTQTTDMSQITNTGPIPVATRVPGDPTRVYNPLNPSKTIRVVDKNGNPYPSGKELKVRGTNFHFYVP